MILAYYYPPLVGAASARAAGFSACLRRLGWQPLVVSPREGFFLRSTAKAPEGVEVVRTRSLELSRLVRRLYSLLWPRPSAPAVGDIEPLPSAPATNALRQLVRDLLYLPDAQVGWIPFAIRAATRVLGESGHGPRVLYSSSGPCSAHLAAMWVARRLQVPWVAEFRDPWTTAHRSMKTTSSWRHVVDRWLEKRILMRADAVVLTAETARDRLLSAFRELSPGKVHVVMSGFDPAATAPPPTRDQPLSILYAGTLYPGDDLEPFLRAIDAIHSREPGAVRFRVAGPPAEWELYRRADPARKSWIELLGLLPQDQTEREMAGSSVLLLHRTNPALTSQQVAGKLFSYVGARRPILAMLAPGSEMEALLRSYADAHIVHEHTPSRLEGVLLSLLSAHRAGLLASPRLSAAAIRPLERMEQARRLSEILASLTSAD